MEILKQNMKHTRGFSLIEVVVALVIFSMSVITIFQLITSTSSSIFMLESRMHAIEVANNRLALMNTIEKPLNKQARKGEMFMGGKLWYWEEDFKSSISPEIFEFNIIIKNSEEKSVYSLSGYIYE
jgi:general secretion pathway protein I